jgi:hypothetical protein
LDETTAEGRLSTLVEEPLSKECLFDPSSTPPAHLVHDDAREALVDEPGAAPGLQRVHEARGGLPPVVSSTGVESSRWRPALETTPPRA